MIPSLVLLCLSVPIQTKVAVVTTDVYFGDKGPYRFLVDTGSQSTLIEPKLAAELGLRPEFRIELSTLHGTHLVPGTQVRTLSLGRHPLPAVEVLFQDLAEARNLSPSIRGVLGSNALTSFDFLLSPSAGRLDFGASRPPGEVMPFAYVDGRIVLRPRMGNESLALVLDSGASHAVLFRTPAAMAKTHSITSTVSTLEGARSVAATTWTADLVFTERLRVGTLPAAIVHRAEKEIDGLLPASIFQRIFVDQGRHEVVLVR